MIHTALARKYRPTRFADLVGQEHVAAGLAGAVAKTRVAHAYLLTGPRGVGKTSAARILAMALNCERRDAADGEPCGACDSCRRIWSGGANLDVVEIDAASNRGVDDARDLRERAMYAASGPDRFKVYIVDEAHMLTREAWNALLKILEEPPPRVVFVFATTEPQKIANTAAPVLSRMQRFDFRRLGPSAIVARLRHVADAEGIDVDDDALAGIARVAGGGMRDALSVLDQVVAFGDGRVTAARVRETLGLIGDDLYAELLDLIAARDAAGVFPFVERVVDAGADLEEFVNGAGETLRALLVRALGGRPEGVTVTLRDAVERHVAGFADGDVLRMLRLLRDCETVIRRSPNARLYVEALVLQWTLLDRTVDLAEVLRAWDRPGGGGRASPREDGPTGRPAPRAGDRETGDPEGKPRAPAPSRPPTAPPSDRPPSLDDVVNAWPAAAEAVGRRRRMLQEALGHARPAALDGGVLTLVVTDRTMHVEGLERGRPVIEEALAEVLGHPLRVAFAAPGAAPPVGPGTDPRRRDTQADREERLRAYRARDETLDAVAQALDLELLD